eukprot:COSAG05_NODE_20113_length_283_cov_0.500000_1_plen_60_part_01
MTRSGGGGRRGWLWEGVGGGRGVRGGKELWMGAVVTGEGRGGLWVRRRAQRQEAAGSRRA